MVTHDEQTARECDRIVWIEGGRVRFDGPADSVLPEGSAFTGSSQPRGPRTPDSGATTHDTRPDARPVPVGAGTGGA